jgi:hypothetical protein
VRVICGPTSSLTLQLVELISIRAVLQEGMLGTSSILFLFLFICYYYYKFLLGYIHYTGGICSDNSD